MSLTHLTDFSDKLSPMLVKELRQGLRSKTFIVVFLSLQIFLAILMLSACMASSSDSIGSVVSGIIFAFFAIAVLVVQPLRGISALSSEVKGNTIDMMVLTRLSASKIVLGKWVAIVSQSALLLSTIIPYLILRYFFGGMNLFAEMVLLALIFITSMALTAVTIGLSSSSSVIIRSIIPLFGTPLLFIGLISLAFNRSTGLLDSCALADSDSRIGILLYILSITYLGGSSLSLGASLIAPSAENHATIRRLVAFILLLLLIPVFRLATISADLVPVLITIIVVPALLIALTESTSLVATTCIPFLKRGRLGEALGVILYPGLASGIFFTGLLSVIACFVFAAHPTMSHGSDTLTIELAFLGSLLFPAVLQVFFFKGEGQRVANYLLILIGSGVLTGILAIITEAMSNRDFLWLFIWNPLTFSAMTRGFDDDVVLGAVSIVDLILLLILVVSATIKFKKIAPVIRDAKDKLSNSASPVPSTPAP